MSEFESIEDELKFMADCSDDRGDSETSLMFVRYLAHIRKLNAELAALKAGHGEAVAWRDHSVNYAKGEKCPATIETLQAAWYRDQELLIGQKFEISRLKETVNQLRQRRTAPPATADAVSVPMEFARFLLGEADLNGYSFGDMHQVRVGKFWWRTELRALIARQEVK